MSRKITRDEANYRDPRSRLLPSKKFQDKATGVWYDILDLPTRKPQLPGIISVGNVCLCNRPRRSRRYLPEKYMKVATRGWEGIKKQFSKVNAQGQTDWEGTVSVSGLGGNPYRDGSFEYYMSESFVRMTLKASDLRSERHSKWRRMSKVSPAKARP
ncbi:MAG: glycoside hydrolase family 88 protein [Acidobacteria bacterium]|nr:glycoside hydrolase family 88 protein [Acidobacteriota bacterium]